MDTGSNPSAHVFKLLKLSIQLMVREKNIMLKIPKYNTKKYYDKIICYFFLTEHICGKIQLFSLLDDLNVSRKLVNISIIWLNTLCSPKSSKKGRLLASERT